MRKDQKPKGGLVERRREKKREKVKKKARRVADQQLATDGDTRNWRPGPT